ncbi:MAG: alkaline phosphatase D family protein [Flavobacteriales bacterium]|nr:alkaline phosphatase D family protein [Flavobacteriales bacterium]
MRIILLIFLLTFKLAAQNDIYHQELAKKLDSEEVFPWGVASGDPGYNKVVLWTKVNPNFATKNSKVGCIVATDSTLKNVVHSSTFIANADSAYTIKIHLQNLQENTYYYYQFSLGDKSSVIGRTKTFARNPKEVNFAIVSCSNYQVGEFNAYGHIANRKDIDVVVHLGDYIYEGLLYKPESKRSQKEKIREHVPEGICYNLKDYRSRYAQYKLDEQLKKCHQLYPFINIWDDHEFYNNLNEDQMKKSNSRFQAGRQAYFEWLPISDASKEHIYRKFEFGGLIDLWMLDGRTEGRSAQVKFPSDEKWEASDRSMLGKLQREWLLEGMKNSNAKWKFLGNQVMFSSLKSKMVEKRSPGAFMDAWEGYPYERQMIFDSWKENNLNNIIVLTGDVHTSWAIDLTSKPRDLDFYDPKNSKTGIGAELITPSVTYFNADEALPPIVVKLIKKSFVDQKVNRHVQFADITNHGYMSLNVKPDVLNAEWHFFKTIKKKDLRLKKAVKYSIKADENILTRD